MEQRRLCRLMCVSGVLVGLATSTAASAHVLLDEPQRRYDDMKGGPCGKGDGLDGRTDRFTRYQPGDTIPMRWTETIDHVGSWVVSFDDDGADAADFEQNVLYTEADPANASGLGWSATVTLPDVTCTNCTLQLVQIMTTNPNPSPSQIYFQCADIVIGDEDPAPAEIETGCGALPSSSSSSSSPAALLLVLLGVAARRRPGRGSARR